MALSKIDVSNMLDETLPVAQGGTGVTSTPFPSNYSPNLNFRNIIINGDMSIAQRGTSFADSSTYGLDRFRFDKSNDGAVTVTQDTDVPSGQGFSKSLKVDVTTADTSIGASQYGILTQRIEAQNLQYLKYGTANAETLTLSFWVKSNKTGTYCVSLVKIDNTRYDYVAEYSISSASTWEKKTITIAPDSNIKASGGAIDNNNDTGLFLQFALADGSSRQGTNETWNTSTPATSTSNQVNFLDSTSNEWYITGVQLEAGTAASDFEFLPVDANLNRCLRYYQQTGSCSGRSYNTTSAEIYYTFHQKMRAAPSLTLIDGTTSGGENGGVMHVSGVGSDNITSVNGDKLTTISCTLQCTGAGGLFSAGAIVGIQGNPCAVSAEL